MVGVGLRARLSFLRRQFKGVFGHGFYFFRRKYFVERCHYLFSISDRLDALVERERACAEVFGPVEAQFAVGAVTGDAVLAKNSHSIGCCGGPGRNGSGLAADAGFGGFAGHAGKDVETENEEEKGSHD